MESFLGSFVWPLGVAAICGVVVLAIFQPKLFDRLFNVMLAACGLVGVVFGTWELAINSAQDALLAKLNAQQLIDAIEPVGALHLPRFLVLAPWAFVGLLVALNVFVRREPADGVTDE